MRLLHGTVLNTFCGRPFFVLVCNSCCDSSAAAVWACSVATSKAFVIYCESPHLTVQSNVSMELCYDHGSAV